MRVYPEYNMGLHERLETLKNNRLVEHSLVLAALHQAANNNDKEGFDHILREHYKAMGNILC